MTGPTVPVSGPEDGARCRCGHAKSEHRKFPCGLGCTVTEGDYWADSCTDFRPVMADTTAGEADAKALRARIAKALLKAVTDYGAGKAAPDTDLFDFYADAVLPIVLAARSGGAQDDGLRGRIEALAEEWEHHHRSLDLQWCADRLRRALAGPDDDPRRGLPTTSRPWT